MPSKTDFEVISASDTRPALLVQANGTLAAFNGVARRGVAGLAEGVSIYTVALDDPSIVRQYLRRCTRTREPQPGALTFPDLHGKPVSWRCDGGLMGRDAIDGPVTVVLRLRPKADAHAGFVALKEKYDQLNSELHHRALTQAQLEEALGTKAVLLSEVNHRVKNNLQVITSMLAMAAHDERDPRIQQKFEQTAARVRAIGTVQDLLYQTEELKDVDCALLVKNLVATLAGLHHRPEISLNVDCEGLRLDPDRATSVALLTTELVSNAYKHAFPDGLAGGINVRLWCADKQASLSVADSGVPMPSSTGTGTGMKIITALARKLDGEFDVMRDGPAKAMVVTFKVD